MPRWKRRELNYYYYYREWITQKIWKTEIYRNTKAKETWISAFDSWPLLMCAQSHRGIFWCLHKRTFNAFFLSSLIALGRLSRSPAACHSFAQYSAYLVLLAYVGGGSNRPTDRWWNEMKRSRNYSVGRSMHSYSFFTVQFVRVQRWMVLIVISCCAYDATGFVLRTRLLLRW